MGGLVETVWLDEIDSTNSYALNNFDFFASGTLVVARRQSMGRGRKGRSWASPPDVNSYASLILKGFKFLPAQASWIGSLAALETIRQSAPRLGVSVKWPNDVLCGGRKIAGVLCEGKFDSRRKPAGIVIGVGVNLNMDAKSLAAIGKPATSILVETGEPVQDVGGFTLRLGEEAMRLYGLALSEGVASLHKTWKSENMLQGRDVEAVLDDGSAISGRVEDLSLDGSLLLRTASGILRSIRSGEVSIRPV